MLVSKLAAGVAIIGAFVLASTSLTRSAQAETIPTRTAANAIERSTVTDFSARRRYVRRGYRNNAGAAFMGLAIGTAGAIIANEHRRSYRRQYVGQPYYGQQYYGQPYYGQYGGGVVSSPYDRYGNYRQCGNGYYGYGCGD